MNPYLEAIILGIVQGITEFLPISSDGHLELAKWILGNKDSASDSFLMTIVLHFGTALAIVWVFKKEIANIIKNIANPEGRRFILLVIISMIPAVIVGVGFEDQMVALFDKKIALVGILLFINGIILILSDFATTKATAITPVRAFIIGIAQAIAILPGISRSGTTISTSLAMGIERNHAANFSFLIVIPLIFGKIAKDVLDGSLTAVDTKAMPLFVGFLVSLIVGIFACRLMLAIVKKGRLRYFGYYCLFIGIVAFIAKLWIWPNH